MRLRNGYVLLMVLVLMIVMVTTLASVATQSLRTTQDAAVAIQQLQQRVGIASCRDTLLEKAFFVFKEMDIQRLNGSIPSVPEAKYMVSDSVVLGEQRFDLVLSDESSKVNLNALFYHSGVETVYKTLQRSLPVEAIRAINLRPAAQANRAVNLSAKGGKSSSGKASRPPGKSNPTNASDDGGGGAGAANEGMIPAFRSWGEVFDLGLMAELNPRRQVQLDFTKTFTLWGSGQTNVLRAPESSILTQLESVLPGGQAKKILDAMRKTNDFSIQTIVEMEIESQLQRQRVRSLIGRDSYAFSLFVDVANLQARSRKLFTISPDANGTQEIQEFVFH